MSSSECHNEDDLDDYVPPKETKEPSEEEFQEPKKKRGKRKKGQIGRRRKFRMKRPIAQRIQRQEKARLLAEKKKWNVTNEQRARYNARKEEVRRYRLATETEAEREERLMKRRMLMRNYMKKRMENETPEERARRLEQARIRAHNIRQKAKEAPNGVMEGVERDEDEWLDGDVSDGFEQFYEKTMEEEDKEMLEIMYPPKESSRKKKQRKEEEKKQKKEEQQKKYVDPETQRTKRIYRIRHKLRTESNAMCYFCLSPLDEGKIPLSSVRKRIEDYGPTIVTANTVPTNLCYDCSHQIVQALDTYDMLIKTQQYWDTVLDKIELKRSGARLNPRLCARGEEKAGFDQIFMASDPVLPAEMPTESPSGVYDASVQFMCRICLTGFMDAAAITLHAILAHKVASKQMIGAQIASHRTIRQIKDPFCVQCWAIFKDDTALEQHKETCKIPLQDQPFTPGWQKPYECEKCGKKYFNRTVLQRHYDLVCFKNREVIDQLRRPCPECGKVFTTVQSMRLHRDSVHAEKRTRHICEKCGKEYLVMKCLDIHRLACDATQPVQAPEPVRSFWCNACHKSFVLKEQLEAHINRVHTQRQTYSCRFCSKGFYQNKSRLTHESRIHAKTRNVACKLCDREFFLMYDLKSHAVVVHGLNPSAPEFKEDILRVITGEEKEKRIRMAMEKFQCDQCGNGFPTEEILTQHRTNGCQDMELDQFGQGVGYIRHTCTKCQRWFKSKDRLDVHYDRGCEDDDPPLTAIYGTKAKRRKFQMDAIAAVDAI